MRQKRIFAILLAVLITVSAGMGAFAADKAAADKARTDTAALMLATVKNPQVDSVGGEWAVLGLARSGYDVPRSYYEGYYNTVEKYVKGCKGVLHDRKYTEYSRVILGLTAAGYDPRNVGGYDLTLPLGDFDKTIWQGINGPTFALIALDSAGYAIPKNPGAATQATRDMYIDEILRRQLSDGGFALSASNTKADSDLTGMVLQALAKYQDRADVKAATDKALDCLSKMQDSEGGFSSGFSAGSSAVESSIQALVALCELGIPADDPRFVKNGKTIADNILSYRNSDGSFSHTHDGSGSNQMATEQALYALAALYRFENGLTSLYDMSDVGIVPPPEKSTVPGLPGKHADVRQVPVSAPGKTFADVAGHANQSAIEALASRGIIDGMGDGMFNPGATMTRAQFATIVTRALGLEQRKPTPFTDVAAGSWYEGYIGAAFHYGLINGRTATEFDPDGLISKQDAATMVARAAKLCGMEIERGATAIRDVLAQFPDYTRVSDYTRGPLAFCYDAGILSQDELNIEPARNISRCEIAEMLCRMLDKANLL